MNDNPGSGTITPVPGGSQYRWSGGRAVRHVTSDLFAVSTRIPRSRPASGHTSPVDGPVDRSCATPQHRVGGNGRNGTMASRISWNRPRDTITSAIWNLIVRPCRTIFAPIFTSRSRAVRYRTPDRHPPAPAKSRNRCPDNPAYRSPSGQPPPSAPKPPRRCANFELPFQQG